MLVQFVLVIHFILVHNTTAVSLMDKFVHPSAFIYKCPLFFSSLFLKESGGSESSREPSVASESGTSVLEFLSGSNEQGWVSDVGWSRIATYSMRSSVLYLATRSLLAGAPVLIWPTPRATERSAMMVFSVSPLRWEIMTPQPSDWAS